MIWVCSFQSPWSYFSTKKNIYISRKLNDTFSLSITVTYSGKKIFIYLLIYISQKKIPDTHSVGQTLKPDRTIRHDNDLKKKKKRKEGILI